MFPTPPAVALDLATPIPQLGHPDVPSTSKSVVEVDSCAARHWESVESRWAAAFRQDPDASPYTSPSWVRTWIEVFGEALVPQIVSFGAKGADPIGACLLTRRARYGAVLPMVRLHINTDGELERDSVVVQHNSLVSRPDARDRVYEAFAAHVKSLRVDELRAAGFEEAGVARLQKYFPNWRHDVEWRESPYVDLQRLRGEGGDHLRAVSRNTREQIRRSLTRYQERGPVSITSASTPGEARAMFEEMLEMHEARWRAVGKGGGFASPLRRTFHRAFVGRGVSEGHAQLLRVTAGDHVIGVLYNLVANGRVNFYQSGLRYEEDKRLKPGLVTHHLAIHHCLQAGFTEYDFLMSKPGEGRYKESLSNSTRRLGWVTLYRTGWRQRYFTFARAMRLRATLLRNGAPIANESAESEEGVP